MGESCRKEGREKSIIIPELGSIWKKKMAKKKKKKNDSAFWFFFCFATKLDFEFGIYWEVDSYLNLIQKEISFWIWDLIQKEISTLSFWFLLNSIHLKLSFSTQIIILVETLDWDFECKRIHLRPLKSIEIWFIHLILHWISLKVVFLRFSWIYLSWMELRF